MRLGARIELGLLEHGACYKKGKGNIRERKREREREREVTKI